MSCPLTLVTKRNSIKQPFMEVKMFNRLSKLLYAENNECTVMQTVNIKRIINEVYSGRLWDGMTTSELDVALAKACIYLSASQPDYDVIARRIIVSWSHKNHSKSLTVFLNQAKEKHLKVLQDAYLFVEKNNQALTNIVQHDRDYLYEFEVISNNGYGRFQYVLLLIIVSDILAGEKKGNDEKEPSKRNERLLNAVKDKYNELCKNPVVVKKTTTLRLETAAVV